MSRILALVGLAIVAGATALGGAMNGAMSSLGTQVTTAAS